MLQAIKMLSKYAWLISVEKISFIRSCDMEVIKATDCITKVHITSGNIKWRSFALRFCASTQKEHDNLCFPLQRAYLLLLSSTLMQESWWSSPFLFYVLSFGKHIVLERSWYIYPIGCKLSWTIIVDITLQVKGWGRNYKPLSFSVSN